MRTPLGHELPRVITPATAARIGVSRSRVRTEIRHGMWRPLAAGAVLTRPDEPSRFDWLEAAIATSGPTAAISGWDAVHLQGVGRAAPPSARPLVLVRTGRSKAIGPVLVRRTDRPYGWRFTPLEHPVLPLAPTVMGPRAVADAALMVGNLAAVRSLVAGAVQRRLATVEELNSELIAGPRGGSRHLRTALAEVAEGARSAAEADAVAQLRRSRLPEYELNVPVVDRAGTLLFVVDVLWRRYRAALEIDSREFHFERDDWQATLARHNVLTGGMLSIVHYPPSVVTDRSSGWLTGVERWLRGRASELRTAYAPGPPRRPARVHNPVPWVLDPVRIGS
jgi:hypothetical protein